jgi:hypothetical protein
MCKIAALVVTACVVLASPVLGVWKYKGTDFSMDPPGWAYDPNGTWVCYWSGYGTVDAGPLYLEAEGWTRCESHVQLWPYYDNQFSTLVMVSYSVYAISHYEWEGNGSKNISYWVTNTVDSGSGITYEGVAIDDTHVNTVATVSGAEARAGCSVSAGGSVDTVGYGAGYAVTQSGSYARNGTEGNPTVSEDWADWGYPPPYLYNQWYAGSLQFTADEEDGGYINWDQSYPQIMQFDVSAKVGGNSMAVGDIEITDPEYEWLRLASRAIHYISGATHIDLEGNIE